MRDLTFEFQTIDWNDLSAEEITSLYLFGTFSPLLDLNDRIRPVVSGDQKIQFDTTQGTPDLITELR